MPDTNIQIPEGVPLEFHELFDALMEKIEPELVSDNIEALNAELNDLPETDRVARGKKYAAAFRECYKRFRALVALRKQELLTFGEEIKTGMKEDVKQEGKASMEKLKQSLRHQ